MTQTLGRKSNCGKWYFWEDHVVRDSCWWSMMDDKRLAVWWSTMLRLGRNQIICCVHAYVDRNNDKITGICSNRGRRGEEKVIEKADGWAWPISSCVGVDMWSYDVTALFDKNLYFSCHATFPRTPTHLWRQNVWVFSLQMCLNLRLSNDNEPWCIYREKHGRGKYGGIQGKDDIGSPSSNVLPFKAYYGLYQWCTYR